MLVITLIKTLIILLKTAEKMSNQVKQDQLYDDLSAILVLIKRIFKNLLVQVKQEQPSKGRESSNEEAIIITKCSQLIWKYKKAIIKKAENLSILGRFMCRIKQILSQISICIPKEKLQIMILLKKMELVTVKGINNDNSAPTIVSLLEIISNCNLKLIHALKIKTVQVNGKGTKVNERQAEKVEKQTIVIESKDEVRVSTIENKQNQAQMLSMHLQKYSIMGIDKQFFRGRYFDLKAQDNSSVFQENMFRNRNIKTILAQFDKDYNKLTSRKNSTTIPRKKSTKQYFQPSPISCELSKPNTNAKSNLFKAKKQISSRMSNSQRNTINKSNKTLSYLSIEDSASVGLESYRSMYEQKVVKSRNKKTIKLTNTIIDIPNTLNSSHCKQISTQRWNFYKKSQEHLKFRYKYYQNKSSNTTPLSNRAINPEIMYNTLFNK